MESMLLNSCSVKVLYHHLLNSADLVRVVLKSMEGAAWSGIFWKFGYWAACCSSEFHCSLHQCLSFFTFSITYFNNVLVGHSILLLFLFKNIF